MGPLIQAIGMAILFLILIPFLPFLIPIFGAAILIYAVVKLLS